MAWSFNARLAARVWGLPAVAVAAIAASAIIVFAPGPLSPKVIALIIVGVVIAALSFRIVKGGEQGTTDLEIVDGERRITIINIPLGVAQAVLGRGLNVYARRPLALPAGVIKGVPAQRSSVVELASAGLPESVEVATEPIQVPEGAAGLSIGTGAAGEDREPKDDRQGNPADFSNSPP